MPRRLFCFKDEGGKKFGVATSYLARPDALKQHKITVKSPWRLLENNIKIAVIDLAHDRLE